MSEEIKERLEKLRREYRPSMAGDVCLSCPLPPPPVSKGEKL